MGLIEVKKDFSQRELLWFGPLMALFVGILGTIAIRRFDAPNVAYGLWTVTAALIVLYYLIPSMRKPTYLAWIYAVMPIGWVVSHVLLAAIYYMLLTPVGLIMRLCRYDPMQRRFDRDAQTYWIARDSQRPKSSYFKQY